MIIKCGYISNSSSTNFLILNCPLFNTVLEVLEYFKLENNNENYDICQAIFNDIQKRETLDKNEIMQYIIISLKNNYIPMYDTYFKSNIDWILENSWDDYLFELKCKYYYKDLNIENIKEYKNILFNFIKRTPFDLIFGLISSCYEIKGVDKEFYKDKYNAKENFYKLIAESIYEKLDKEGLLKSVVNLCYHDDSDPEIESGKYFKNRDNIIVIDNH